MRRLTWLALVLALPACDAAAVEYTDPDDLRLEIVSGDGQVAPVQTTSSGAFILAAPPAGVLPDTLVARIRDKSGGHANVPPNTVVNYVVPTDGCGEPWINAASPDDSAYVATLWERPAGKLPALEWHGDVWGSLCTLETRTVVDGVFKTDTTFQAIFTPGPIARYGTGTMRGVLPDSAFPGDSLDLFPAIETYEYRDAHGNPVSQDTLFATFGWAFYGGYPDSTGTGSRWPNPDGPASHERYVVVPDCDPNAELYHEPGDRVCGNAGIKLWFGEHDGGGVIVTILDPAAQ